MPPMTLENATRPRLSLALALTALALGCVDDVGSGADKDQTDTGTVTRPPVDVGSGGADVGVEIDVGAGGTPVPADGGPSGGADVFMAGGADVFMAGGADVFMAGGADALMDKDTDVPPGGGGGSGGAPMGGMPMGGAEPPPPPTDDVAYGHVDTAAIAGGNEAACPDLTGDGQPDNSFSGIAFLANAQLQTAIDEGSLSLLPVTEGLAPLATEGQFTLSLLTGQAGGAGYIVEPDSLNPDGTALIRFEGAEAIGGRLRAGPGNLVLALPVMGNALMLQLTNASINGAQIAADANRGLTIGQGVISGQLSQADLNTAIQILPADVRGLVPIVLRADIDSDGDNRADSYSLCLTFEAGPTIVDGFPVVAP